MTNLGIYSLSGYGDMINDTGRMAAYFKVLKTIISSDKVVLDIGTGTGILSLLACHLGAKKVYAIEPADAIWVAQEIARVNGYSDRIEFIQDISTNITLPKLVDVIISDLRGVLPLFQRHIPSLIDARQRFLKSNGVLVPQQDMLWVTVVEATEMYQDFASPWTDQPYGFDMTAATRYVTNTWKKAQSVTPEMFLVEPQCWATLDYRTIMNPNVTAELEWLTERTGLAHGLCLWFDATLIEGVGFSNAPSQPDLIYGKAFFPFSHPINLEKNDVINLKLKANLVGDDYIWRWATKVLQQGNAKDIKASFNQSTFFATPISPKQLQKQSDQFVPQINNTAKVDKLALNLMENALPLGTIAQRLTEQFSDRFPTWKSALTYVGELSQRYSD